MTFFIPSWIVWGLCAIVGIVVAFFILTFAWIGFSIYLADRKSLRR